MSQGFQFKQFYVAHDRCAMKVGTDGVLLGASAPIPTPSSPHEPVRILDIGTGSGLIALMLAQRTAHLPHVHITGIDIDEQACTQAAANFSQSPWAQRLSAACCPIQQWNDQPYHLIVSNPPYFMHSLQAPNEQRTIARHTRTLDYHTLLLRAHALLHPTGSIALIIPADAEQHIQPIATHLNLCCTSRCIVYPKVGKAPKRVILTWQHNASHSPTHETSLTPTPDRHTTIPITSSLTLQTTDAPRSDEYIRLTQDFYL